MDNPIPGLEALQGLIVVGVAVAIGVIVKWLTDAIKDWQEWRGVRVIKLAGALCLGLSTLAIVALEIRAGTFKTDITLIYLAAKCVFTGLVAFIAAIKANKWIKTTDTPPDGG